MAKSRFRRKSYRKKTKTARRQKRKSRRMRGGENMHDILQTVNTDRTCKTLIAKSRNPEVFDLNVTLDLDKINLKNMTVHQLLNEVKQKSGNNAIGINDVEYVSGCDNQNQYRSF
jgi:hypothetical protein